MWFSNVLYFAAFAAPLTVKIEFLYISVSLFVYGFLCCSLLVFFFPYLCYSSTCSLDLLSYFLPTFLITIAVYQYEELTTVHSVWHNFLTAALN